MSPASKSLAVAGDQETWTRVQLNALRRAGFDAPVRDLDLLFHIARGSRLDPLRGHLYMVLNERDEWQVRTTIAGLLTAARRAANATGDSLGIGPPVWADADQKWLSVWTGSTPPAAAMITVTRAGMDFTSIALFAEYAVFTEQGHLNRTWLRHPAGQLAKCAKAAALRDAFPDELAGLYTDDEMEHNGNPTVPGVVVATQSETLTSLLAEDDDDE